MPVEILVIAEAGDEVADVSEEFLELDPQSLTYGKTSKEPLTLEP